MALGKKTGGACVAAATASVAVKVRSGKNNTRDMDIVWNEFSSVQFSSNQRVLRKKEWNFLSNITCCHGGCWSLTPFCWNILKSHLSLPYSVRF